MAALRPGDVVITMVRSALSALDVLSQLKDRGVCLHIIDLGGDVTGNGISKLVFTQHVSAPRCGQLAVLNGRCARGARLAVAQDARRDDPALATTRNPGNLGYV
jgi:hypothetical protein